MKLSGTIITYNEDDHIKDVIHSLQQVCDEIIVVDSLSTDKTVEIAESLGAKVVLQKYLGEGKQRKITEEHTSNDWILALDADERLDEEMVETIRSLDFSDPKIGFEFNRKSYRGNHWMRGPGFYPDYLVRLYNKTEGGYEPRHGHAGVKTPAKRRVPGHIIHYTYDDISDWLDRINQVTSLDAQGMFEKGRPPSNIRPILSAFNAGFKKFILKGGIFRGYDSWTITLTSVFRTYMKYLKLNELHEQKAAGSPPEKR